MAPYVNGWGWQCYSTDSSNGSIYNDPERGNVLRIRYGTELPGGSSPVTYLAGGGWKSGLSDAADGAPYWVTKLFMGCYVKFSSNYVDRNVATKFVYFWNTPASPYNHILLLTRQARPLVHPWFALQYQGGTPATEDHYIDSSTYSPAGSFTALPAGAWHKVEYYIELNSVAGTADGIYRCYIDGTLVREETNIMYVKTGDVRNIDWWKFEPIYGGGSLSPLEDMYMYVDDWYVKVGA